MGANGSPIWEMSAQSMRGIRQSKVWRVIQVAAGNFLESYDVVIFAYFAPSIGRAYFPSDSEFATLMATFMTFGVAYLSRPLGAILIGPYVDRYGRRRGLILTLCLMAIGTLAISTVPSFGSIGYLAPILVVCGRLVQGLSAGVEFGSVSVYLAEIATPGHRGFFVSWQSASVQIAVVTSALLGMTANSLLPPEAMESWGWRVPLWIGCGIIPLLFILRRSLQETEAFATRAHHLQFKEIWQSLANNWRLVLTGVFLVSLSNASFYMITTYTPTFGKSVLHLTQDSALLVTCCIGLSNFLLVPIGGALSDHFGRRPLLLLSAALMLLSAYPAMRFLVGAPSFNHLLGVELWLSLIYSGYNGALIVFVTEIMPFEVRTAGFSLAYSISQAIFGGFTPLICTWLIHATGDNAVPGGWLSAVALLSLGALFIHRRKPESFDQLPAVGFSTPNLIVRAEEQA